MLGSNEDAPSREVRIGKPVISVKGFNGKGDVTVNVTVN
jgi:hypothetical protein